MQQVPNLAGVSTSTVSRVINEHPRVSAATAESVRRAMKQISFTPAVRRGGKGQSVRSGRSANISLLVFGTCGSQMTPAFEQLLHGVSAAASEHNLNMNFSFVSDPQHLPPSLVQRRVDGLLLHGERPGAAVESKLRTLPTVWLMANRQRPAWGDQVMPDNTSIGELAAGYLLKRGHRRLAYLSVQASSWALEVRSLSFCRHAREGGAQVSVLVAPLDPRGDYWLSADLPSLADALVDRLLQLDPRPTGLFIAEDRLVGVIDAALLRRGLRLGPDNGRGTDGFDVISCNNERRYLIGLNPMPATIDIRAESIGRRGVEQLLWRMSRASVPERVRTMIEPVLVEPVETASPRSGPSNGDRADPRGAASGTGRVEVSHLQFSDRAGGEADPQRAPAGSD